MTIKASGVTIWLLQSARACECSLVKLSAWVRPVLAMVVAATVIAGANAQASADDSRPGREPGLPYMECIGYPSIPCDPTFPDIVNDYGWLNAAQTGLAGSVRAKQWARVPIGMVAAVAEFGYDYYDGPWDSNQTIDLRIRSFFTSPAGSKNPYGDSMLIPVRTVAFGSIPVQVTLQVSQSRKANGDLIPLQFVDRSRSIKGPHSDPTIGSIDSLGEGGPLQAKVDVKVRAISVDGVDVGLDGVCHTGPRASLDLRPEPFTLRVPKGAPDTYMAEHADPNRHFYSSSGGSLSGTIDIPSFSGCTTRTGDEISPLLTSAISGPGNPITAKIGLVACVIATADGRLAPNPPGVTSPYDPRSGCDTSLKNGNFEAVPKPLPFPDHAPGDD